MYAIVVVNVYQQNNYVFYIKVIYFLLEIKIINNIQLTNHLSAFENIMLSGMLKGTLN